MALPVDMLAEWVGRVTGAGVTARREVWRGIGNFDPRHLLYFKDAALCDGRMGGLVCVRSPDGPCQRRL